MKRGLGLLMAVCLLAVAGCSNDNSTGGSNGGGTPTIVGFSPAEVSRGQQDVEGTITGTNLTGVTDVNLGDGITVEQFTGTSSSTVSVHFSVSANAAGGPRTIRISTPRGSAASSSTLLTVSTNQAPVAKFSIFPTIGAKNTTFTMDASASSDSDGKISSYHWDFGDGQSENGKIVTHKYSSTGTFTITLTVQDNDHATDQATNTVEVKEGKAPIARFFFSPDGGDTRVLFTFNANNSSDQDGTIQSYSWDFGDGKKADGPIVTHKFEQGGTYHVTLVVTDNNDLQGSIEKDLKVSEFNELQAVKEITNVVEDFFNLYSQLDHLTAEQIVVGWADTPDCLGRQHEIDIIENQQTYITKTTATIVGGVDVFIDPSGYHANADVAAHFDWTQTDGTEHQGNVQHNFTLIYLDGRWQICDFTVTSF